MVHMDKPKRNVLFSVPFPLTLRNFISTGLAAQIEKRFDAAVHLISPYDDTVFSDNEENSFPNYSVASSGGSGGLPHLQNISLFDSALKSIHLTGFAIEYPDGSLQNITLNARRNLQWYIARALTKMAPRKSQRRIFLRNLYSHYKPKKKEVVDAFDRINPEFVLVASPGHYWLDHFVLDEAKRRGIPGFCIVLSWDNLYSRGPLCRRPDFLLVWSEEMKRQAIDVHGFPEDRISVAGALQFMFYDSPSSRQELADMRTKIGLGPDERYIAYVCGARTGEYDVEDVVAMREVLLAGPYRDLKIVVRPHPQGSKEAYARLRKEGILLDDDLDLTSGRSTPDTFNRSAIRHMAAFLTDADFVISSWGTTALLEACIFDVPAIQLRWMDAVSHKNNAEVQMVRDFQRYIHMKAFDAEGARLYCDHPGELVTLMREIKKNGYLFSLKRNAVVQKLVCLPLGDVIPRVCENINMFLDKDMH